MGDLRENLRASIAGAAAPYGYTITIASSGSIAMSELGSPAPGETLLFLVGAALGFLVVGLSAFGALTVDLRTPSVKRTSLLGMTHVLSAGVAALAVWGSSALLGGPGGWAVAGFIATVLYLVLTAAQITAGSPGEGPGGDSAAREA
jgi:hypothetical protein